MAARAAARPCQREQGEMMDLVRTFSFTHSLRGKGAKSADEGGIALADGSSIEPGERVTGLWAKR